MSCHQEPTQDLPEIGDEGHGAPQILKILWKILWKILKIPTGWGSQDS